MCVIVAKKKNVNPPSKETLMTCFKNNPDGCGYMYTYKGKVYIRKGFMTFNDFWTSYEKICRIVDPKQTPFVYHFRISTQGGVNKELTHPFPLTDDVNALMALRLKTDIGIAHNGIISLTSTYLKNAKYSDTQLFIRDYLTTFNTLCPRWYLSDLGREFVETLIDSKLAILDKKGTLETIGEFIENDGILYSNTSYMETRQKLAPMYAYSWYDDDDYYGDWNARYSGQWWNEPKTETKYIMPLFDHDEVYVKTEDGELFAFDGLDYGMSADGTLYELSESHGQFSASFVDKPSAILSQEGVEIRYRNEDAELMTVYKQ